MSTASHPTSSSEEPQHPVADAHAGHAHGSATAEPECQDAVAELYAFLDGELSEGVMVQVEAHLRRCSPCLEAFDFEADLRRVIAAKCSEQVPSELRDRFCGMLRDLGTSDGGAGPDGLGVPAGPDGS